MKGNWVCTFTTDSVLKGIALLFKDTEELDVRAMVGKQFNTDKCYWAGIDTEEEFYASPYNKDFEVVETRCKVPHRN